MSVSSSTSVTTTSSQYLTPDFYPTNALDAKNSPLALLVQTCSSIGRDNSKSSTSNINNNNNINSNDKKDNSATSSSFNNNNTSTKDGSSRQKTGATPEKLPKSSQEERRKLSNGSEYSGKKDERLNNNNVNNNKSNHSNSFKSSPNKSANTRTPSLNNEKLTDRHPNTATYSDKYGFYNDDIGTSSLTNSSRYMPSYFNGYLNKLNNTNNGYFPIDPTSQEYLVKNSFYPLYNSMKLQEAMQNASTFPAPSSALSSLYPSIFSYPLSLDPIAAAYSANFAAAVQAAAASQAVSVSSQQKSPTGATTASGLFKKCNDNGLCKDPSCTGSHMTSHLKSHSPHCTSTNCNQCSDKTTANQNQHNSSNNSTAASLQAAANLFYPGSIPPVPSLCLPPFNPLLLTGGLGASLFNSSMNGPLPQPHHQQQHGQQHFICNWVQGSEYCGKRFSSSEELLIHLHGHTTESNSPTLPSPPQSSSTSLNHHNHHHHHHHQKQPPPPPQPPLPPQALPPFNPAALPPLPFPLSSYFGATSSSRSHPSARSLSSSPNYPHHHLTPAPHLNATNRSRGSPNSLLSSARYHPYKSPTLSMTPPSLTAPHSNILNPSFPSLAAYYSPYALYNQHLNPAAAVAGP